MSQSVRLTCYRAASRAIGPPQQDECHLFLGIAITATTAGVVVTVPYYRGCFVSTFLLLAGKRDVIALGLIDCFAHPRALGSETGLKQV